MNWITYIFKCKWVGHDFPHPMTECVNGFWVETNIYKCHECGKRMTMKPIRK